MTLLVTLAEFGRNAKDRLLSPKTDGSTVLAPTDNESRGLIAELNKIPITDNESRGLIAELNKIPMTFGDDAVHLQAKKVGDRRRGIYASRIRYSLCTLIGLYLACNKLESNTHMCA